MVKLVEWADASEAYHQASLSCPQFAIEDEAPLARVIRTGHPYGQGIKAAAVRIVEGT